MISFGMGPARGEDGTLAITLPMGDAKLPGIAASDIGACAYGIFREGVRWIGRSVGVAGGHLTGEELASGLAAALGEPVIYNRVTPAVYRSLGFPGAEELANMFQFKAQFEDMFCAARNLETSRRLHPGLTSYGRWLEQNIERIPVPVAVG